MFAVTASQVEGAEQPKGWCLKQHAGGHILGLKPRHCSALSAQAGRQWVSRFTPALPSLCQPCYGSQWDLCGE